jgi:hypothetical protein
VSRAAAGAAVLLALALTGCGGGSDAPSKVKPAVDDWAAAVNGFTSGLRNCGSSLNAAHGYFAACTKPFKRNSDAAARRVEEAARGAADAHPSCRADAAGLASFTGSVADRQDAVVRSSDAAKDGSGYSGPPIAEVEQRTRRLIAADVGRAREAAAAIDKGCPKP